MCTRFIFFLVFFYALSGMSQRTEIYNEKIKTIRMCVGKDSGMLPVLRLNSNDKLEVSFDELSHDYHRYSYSIRHLNADFNPEDLLVSDYVWSVTDEELIEDYTQSMNTTVLYTHYRFSLPNARMKPLLSGNYELTVWNDSEMADEPNPLFRSFFYVTEDLANINTTITTDTDIDRNAAHQQLSVKVGTSSLNLYDVSKEIKMIVLQNNRWDNAVTAPSPTGQTGNMLLWQNCRDLIFTAGNEYRKFELISTRYPGMHIDGIHYYAPYYHATLMSDVPRKNHLYDEDQNGRFVPLSNNSGNADYEADYVWVHFNLAKETLPQEEHIYINGNWTYDQFTPPYRMKYNVQKNVYEGDVLLKQGYYSYQYLSVDHQGKGNTQPVEGDFFQTENEYTVLLYYRKLGARYDRLVGWRTGHIARK